VEDFPVGYPRLACFLESDPSFMVYRRFGVVFARLLLNKQDELRTLEEMLFEMDRTDAEDEEGLDALRSRKEDVSRNMGKKATRTQLLAQLEKKALEYSKAQRSNTHY
jgi:hypothetical protein